MSLPDGVTQRDIAAHLGIAVSTVSRALSDSPRVSRLTREAVRRAARELAARQAATDTTAAPLMIGVTHSHAYHGLQDHNHESVLEQVLGGVEVACRRHNAVPYPWQQSHLLARPEAEPFFERVSGVIMSGGEIDDDVISAIQARGKPIVLIGGHRPGAPISSVAADSLDGMYRATRHLVDLGHRRIALINGPNTTYTSREKKAGYLTALADAGVPFDPDLLVARDERGGFTDVAVEALTREILALPLRPTALIFATDTMARTGYRVCRELGLSIPGDLATVGFHDDHAAFADPPLTSIRVDRTAWGVAAAELLMRIISGQEGHASRSLLPVELIVRESSARPGRVADAAIA
jgi:DNA-binding LacI/PurR family transcriptional regulator